MLSFLLFSACGLALPAGYHPVVIAGPFMGQNLEVMNENLFSICNTKGKWDHFWMNMTGIDDFYCIAQGLELGGWDHEKKMSIPKDNVRVRPFGYAGSERIQLDGISGFAGGDILVGDESNLVPRLKTLGYKVGESIFGHTYDWRLSVRDWEQQYYPSFKLIIEEAVEKANGSPVVLTGISMAGQYTHAFLSWVRREYGPDWAIEHVHAFAPVAAGWNGAVMALSVSLNSVLATWSTEGDCPNCDPKRASHERRRFEGLTDWMKGYAMEIGDDLLQNVFSSFPALYLVSPGIDHSTNPPTDHEVFTVRNSKAPAECSANPKTATVCGAKEDASGYNFELGFLANDQCGECVWTYSQCEPGFDRAHDGWTQDLCCKRHQCESRTYRASEIPELLREVGQEDHARMMEYALTIDTTSDPGVPVHCIYSHNIQTFNGLNMATNGDNKQEVLEGNRFLMDDGDQTVDHASLEVCDRWDSTVKSYKVAGVAHSSMLNVDQVLDVIIAVATEDQATLEDWTPPKYSEISPIERAVSPDVLLKRDGFCAICDKLSDLNADATYFDDRTQKVTRCGDADSYCSNHVCGEPEEVKAFFKDHTDCCKKALTAPANAVISRLQKKTE